jgi:pimeloyl-ACP methyl ester carboxylesterase
VITRHYSKHADGQIHWRECGPGDAPVLLCLHPAPYSGIYFETVMPLLAEEYRLIAPDYPGYGGSAPRGSLPAIEDYASAMWSLLDETAREASVHILGFHTGCLVAVEMAVQRSSGTDGLVLVDVPYFTGEKQQQMLAAAAKPLVLDAEGEAMATLWQKGVAARLEAMPISRSVELLAEQLRVADRSHLAFHAAFIYACDQRLADLETAVHVIATQSGLLDATRAFAAQSAGLALEERLDITRAVFEEGAADIARSINAALPGG